MGEEPASRRILQLFAQVLDYPGPGLSRAAHECAALVEPASAKAATLLRTFGAFVEARPAGLVEELYTRAFDLGATCYPYVGYYLLGESYKRSVLLLRLKECYQAWGIRAGSELPDHLAVLLRFLAVCTDTTLVEELVHAALLPALESMLRPHGDQDPAGTQTPEPASPARTAEWIAPDPYCGVLRALRLALAQFYSGADAAISGG